MTLTEFLLARIAEDEAVARDADSGRWIGGDKGVTFEWDADDWHDEETQARLMADMRANQYHITEWSPARVLAECEGKRAIVDRCSPYDDLQVRRQTRTLAHDALLALALPYADHPDFDAGWCA